MSNLPLMVSTAQFLGDAMDQLDLALEQIAANDRNLDRFALMLVDNAIELGLHRRAEEARRENDFFTHRPPHDEKHVDAALGMKFVPKASLARSMKWITETQFQSITHAHRFRNTAYHAGARHGSILHSLVIFYLKHACQLYADYEPFGRWGSSADVISARALKYTTAGDLLRIEETASAFARLRDAASDFEDTFIMDLSIDFARSIQRFDEELDFLAQNLPQARSRDRYVLELQAWSFVVTAKGVEFAASHGWGQMHPTGYIDRLIDARPWTEPGDPVKKWQRRQTSLEKEKNADKAFDKYCQFVTETDALRTAVSRAASAVDHEIG